MKRMSLLVLLVFVLFSTLSASAQGIIIAQPTPTPTMNPDLDGDGVGNERDLCPTVAGDPANRGCPSGNPVTTPEPSNPNPQPGEPPRTEPTISTPPPFVPPSLSPDTCAITPARDGRVNVRSAPSMDAEVIGSLFPGVVYPALGYVVNGAEVWMQLVSYEGGDGSTPGYSALSVVISSAFCPEIPRDATLGETLGGADSFLPNPESNDIICHMTVGYDAAFWGSDYDAALGDESIGYAAFYFEAAPGEPIAAGTPVWGVVYIDGFNELPPDSPWFYENPDNAVAVLSDPSVIEAAVNGGVSTAWDLAFPNPNGGVMATNGMIFYRISDPEFFGTCGPIIGIAPTRLTTTSTADDGTEALQCFNRPGSTTVESCWCESSDTDCIGFLTSICTDEGAAIQPGRDMTACWYERESQLGVFRDESARFATDPNTPDCNDNGIPDVIEDPVPPCVFDLTSDTQEPLADDVDWWRTVLPLSCGGGQWYIMYNTNEDGTREVVDAGCGVPPHMQE